MAYARRSDKEAFINAWKRKYPHMSDVDIGWKLKHDFLIGKWDNITQEDLNALYRVVLGEKK